MGKVDPWTLEDVLEAFAESIADAVRRVRDFVEEEHEVARAKTQSAIGERAELDRAHGSALTHDGDGPQLLIIDRAIQNAKRDGGHKQAAIGLRFSGDEDCRTLERLAEWAKVNGITRSRLIVEILNVVMQGGSIKMEHMQAAAGASDRGAGAAPIASGSEDERR